MTENEGGGGKLGAGWPMSGEKRRRAILKNTLLKAKKANEKVAMGEKRKKMRKEFYGGHLKPGGEEKRRGKIYSEEENYVKGKILSEEKEGLISLSWKGP